MSIAEKMSDYCDKAGCWEPRVSGQRYCEDHLLEVQVRKQEAATRTKTEGTLADLIRNAKKQGLIAPVLSGYRSA